MRVDFPLSQQAGIQAGIQAGRQACRQTR